MNTRIDWSSPCDVERYMNLLAMQALEDGLLFTDSFEKANVTPCIICSSELIIHPAIKHEGDFESLCECSNQHCKAVRYWLKVSCYEMVKTDFDNFNKTATNEHVKNFIATKSRVSKLAKRIKNSGLAPDYLSLFMADVLAQMAKTNPLNCEYPLAVQWRNLAKDTENRPWHLSEDGIKTKCNRLIKFDDSYETGLSADLFKVNCGNCTRMFTLQPYTEFAKDLIDHKPHSPFMAIERKQNIAAFKTGENL